jgi:hypothetical protein
MDAVGEDRAARGNDRAAVGNDKVTVGRIWRRMQGTGWQLEG